MRIADSPSTGDFDWTVSNKVLLADIQAPPMTLLNSDEGSRKPQAIPIGTEDQLTTRADSQITVTSYSVALQTHNCADAAD